MKEKEGKEKKKKRRGQMKDNWAGKGNERKGREEGKSEKRKRVGAR